MDSSRPWRRLLRLVRGLLVAYVIVLLLMMFLENRFVYFPSVYPDGDWQPVGLHFEDAEFSAADGTRLHGWFVPHEKPRAVVLIAHGNAGNVTHRAHLLEAFHRQRTSVLAFDYRGFGKSQGRPNEKGILADARAARTWLAERTGVAETEIVLFGESLGGGVMVDLAAEDGAGGLILLSTFTSLPDVAARVYPWLPVRMLMSNKLDSLAKIGRYIGPVLQIHGDADEIVPYTLGQKLHAAIADPAKQFVTLRGGTHNGLPPRAFEDGLAAFFERLTPEQKPHRER